MGIHINLYLTFQPLKILQGQIIVDFFIEHGIGFGDENNYLICKKGQGIGISLTKHVVAFGGSLLVEQQATCLIILFNGWLDFDQTKNNMFQHILEVLIDARYTH
ncbi:hypothetical protein ACJX0J_040623 [Zea mays]